MGATIRRAARSWTALMWAAHCGHVDVMVALMYFGADQSKRAQHGRYSGCALAAFSCGRQSRTGHQVRVVFLIPACASRIGLCAT